MIIPLDCVFTSTTRLQHAYQSKRPIDNDHPSTHSISHFGLVAAIVTECSTSPRATRPSRSLPRLKMHSRTSVRAIHGKIYSLPSRSVPFTPLELPVRPPEPPRGHGSASCSSAVASPLAVTAGILQVDDAALFATATLEARRRAKYSMTNESQRIDVKEDFKNLGQMPCARTALLSGIAGGTGIGAVRFLASHRMSLPPEKGWFG